MDKNDEMTEIKQIRKEQRNNLELTKMLKLHLKQNVRRLKEHVEQLGRENKKKCVATGVVLSMNDDKTLKSTMGDFGERSCRLRSGLKT